MIDARVQANYRTGYWRGIFGPTKALGHIFEENKSGTSVDRCAALIYAMLIDDHRRPCSGFFWVCLVFTFPTAKARFNDHSGATVG